MTEHDEVKAAVPPAASRGHRCTNMHSAAIWISTATHYTHTRAHSVHVNIISAPFLCSAASCVSASVKVILSESPEHFGPSLTQHDSADISDFTSE